MCSIVGAGPAGTAAAIELRRQGRDVIVIDKATFPRDKCCGDGLTTDCLRQLEELGLQPERRAQLERRHRRGDLQPRGREVTTAPPRGRPVRRGRARDSTSTRAMVELAAAQRRPTSVDGRGVCAPSTTKATTWWSGPAEDPIACRYVMAADGMWSPGPQGTWALDDPGYRGEWHAFRQYFSECGPGRSAPRRVVRARPVARLCLVVPPPGPASQRRVRHSPLERQSRSVTWAGSGPTSSTVRAVQCSPRVRMRSPRTDTRPGPFPARVDGLARTAHRVSSSSATPSAATDPMTGEGIAQALVSGRLAASAIERRRRDQGRTLLPRHYERAVDHHLTTDHRFARFLAKLLEYPARCPGGLARR